MTQNEKVAKCKIHITGASTNPEKLLLLSVSIAIRRCMGFTTLRIF